MKIKYEDWVVVADAGKFMVLENRGDDDLLDLRVLAAETRETTKASDIGSDKPGRLAEAGSRRIATEATDWHELDEKRAGEDLAERINAWARASAFKDLTIIADPKTLGTVRKGMDDEVRGHQVHTIAADLTHFTVPQIEEWLGKQPLH